MTQLADAEELADLQNAVAELCADVGDLAPAREMETSTTDHDPVVWSKLGEQMGLAGVGLPEEVDGLGGLAEIVTVSAVLGAALSPVPFWSSTVLAGQILTAVRPLPVELLAQLAGGQLFAAAVADADGRWTADRVLVQSHDDGSGCQLTGRVHFVAGGLSAAVLLVAAHGSAGVDLFAVDTGGAGVTVTAARSLDFTRPLSSVELAGAAAQPLTVGGTGTEAISAGVDIGLIALAAEQAAGARRCLDMTVEYTKIRRQFSRPIGGFQVVKHRLVDMLAQVEFALSAVDRAVLAGSEPSQLAEAASVAAAWCSEAYRDVCAESIQLHGGIGFTWEHDAHLFFRRAHADAVLLGDASHHRERVANLLSW